jgi:hypothetical protein
MKLRLTRWDPEGTQRARYEVAVKSLAVRAVLEDSIEMTHHYMFAPMVQGGPMNNEEKAAKFWREKIVPKEMEIRSLVQDCKKSGRRTLAYENAVSDMNKLKAEYEEIKGGKPYDPHSLADAESASSSMTRKFLGER